jgi:hypothetical protein
VTRHHNFEQAGGKGEILDRSGKLVVLGQMLVVGFYVTNKLATPVNDQATLQCACVSNIASLCQETQIPHAQGLSKVTHTTERARAPLACSL